MDNLLIFTLLIIFLRNSRSIFFVERISFDIDNYEIEQIILVKVGN